MDRHNYPYQNQLMARSGDPSTDRNQYWSHDVPPNSNMQWQRPYGTDRGEEIFDLRHSVPIQHYQQTLVYSPRPRYPPAISSYSQSMSGTRRQLYPENEMPPIPVPEPVPSPMSHAPRYPHAMSTQYPDDMDVVPYQRLNSRPMGHSVYPSTGNNYSHNQQTPVLRQLHPSNEQLGNVPEMHSGMQSGPVPVLVQRMVAASTPMPPPGGVEISPQKKRVSPTPKKTPTPATAHQEDITTVSVPGNQKIKRGSSAVSPGTLNKKKSKLPQPKIKTEAKRSEKENLYGDSNDEDDPTPITTASPQSSRRAKTRLVTASVADVLRWRKNCVFTDIERICLLIEVIGTVFDIAGSQPIRISVHSQNSEIKGFFWETEQRLDRDSVAPGCLVRVVMRILQEGNEYHFLKVSRLESRPGIENLYRRIAYVSSTALEKSLKK